MKVVQPDEIASSSDKELNTGSNTCRESKSIKRKPRAVTTEEATLQPQQNAVQSQQEQTQATVKDEKAEAWRDENPWFGVMMR